MFEEIRWVRRRDNSSGVGPDERVWLGNFYGMIVSTCTIIITLIFRFFRTRSHHQKLQAGLAKDLLWYNRIHYNNNHTDIPICQDPITSSTSRGGLGVGLRLPMV